MKKFFTLAAAALATSAFAAIDSAPADVQTWYFNAKVFYPSEEIVNKEVQVAMDGTDLYLTGVYANISTWAKGTTADGVNYAFASQDAGSLWGYAMSYSGYNGDAGITATATLVDGVLTFNTGFGILYTDYPDSSPLIWWEEGATLSAEPLEYQEPVLTDQTASMPYRNNFDSETKRNQVAIYPDDYSGWDWGADWDTNNWYAICNNDGWQNADDYLIFPGVTLEAGKQYVVRFDAKSSSTNAWQYFSVVMGDEAKLSKLVNTVMPTTLCYSTEWNDVEQEFSVEQTATYYLAIHSTSYAYNGYLSVDNFVVEEMDVEKPEPAQDLTVTPGRNGVLSATVNFSMPSANIGGQTYASDKVLSYLVTRGEFIIAEGQQAAGSLVIITDSDNGLTNGFATYKVVISDDTHVSKEVSASAYIGLDYPTETEYMEISVEGNQVTIAWVPVTRGANGGYVGAKYNVYACPRSYQLGEKLNDEPLTECQFTFEYDVESGEQGEAWFAVTAVNDLDESYGNFTSISVGAPYELPYADSFNADDTHIWSFAGQGGGAYIDRWNGFSSDEDGCAMYMYIWNWDTEGCSATATSGKISTAANAQLSFDYKAEGNGTLTILAAGEDATPLAETIAFEAGEGTICLDNIFANVLDRSSVCLYLVGTFEVYYQGLYIDNLKIEVIDVPTGISELNSENAAKMFSLDGKVITVRPAAGFYIQNGQKIMVK